MSDSSISIKKTTLTKLAIIGVAALMIASFFAGYDMGGAGKSVSIMQSTNPAQQQPEALPAGVQPFQLPLQQQGGALPVATPKVSSIVLDGAPTKGKPDAPITFVEFSDFQCPFCESFYNQTYPQILNSYVDTGKVKIVFKQFPIDSLHPNAREAALASECANEQGKFWPYHNALFGNQTTWANQNSTQVVNSLKKYSLDLKLNTIRFDSCLDSKRYGRAIDKDSQEGSLYGVSGTPTFYIGNNKTGYTQIDGTQPFSIFQQTIDQLIKQ